MTEREWLSSENPGAMLTHLLATRMWTGVFGVTPRLSDDRRLRLFACACWRAARFPGAVAEYGEAMADGLPGPKRPLPPPGDRMRFAPTFPDAAEAARLMCSDDPPVASGQAVLLRDLADPFRRGRVNCRDFRGDEPRPCRCRTHDAAAVTWGTSFRCPESFQGKYVTPRVLDVARDAYDRRLPTGFLDQDRLLVLSDALEEAGCDDDHLLRHLRGWGRCPGHKTTLQCWGMGGPATGGGRAYAVRCPACDGLGWRRLSGPHAPGCWALDLAIGKG